MSTCRNVRAQVRGDLLLRWPLRSSRNADAAPTGRYHGSYSRTASPKLKSSLARTPIDTTLGLTVLITNLTMDWLSGTVVYTRDLALELQRQGHRPIVYTWLKGRASRELDAAGIQVFDSLWNIHVPPDVIHGHHR